MKISKVELKRNELSDFISTAVQWIIPHWQTVASIFGAIIVFSSLGIYFYIRYSTVKKSAWDKFSIAQGYAYQGMIEQSIQLLDDIISKFSNIELAQQARITKADICFKTKNYNLSAQLYQQVIDTKKAKNIIPFAYAQLGAAKENLGDYQGAISTYNEFISKFPEHFLTPRIYDSLARVYLVTGSTELAKQTYEKLVTLFPGTYWAQQVQRNFQKPLDK